MVPSAKLNSAVLSRFIYLLDCPVSEAGLSLPRRFVHGRCLKKKRLFLSDFSNVLPSGTRLILRGDSS
jgi:hypothetical protein